MPKSTRADLANQQVLDAWISVVRTYNLCDSALSAQLAALDIRTAEHEVLANLTRDPGMTQQELASRCFSAKSGISMMLTRMEARGWLRRTIHPLDSRARSLHLTAKGRALATRTLAIQAEILAKMAAALSASELFALEDMMKRVAGALLAD